MIKLRGGFRSKCDFSGFGPFLDEILVFKEIQRETPEKNTSSRVDPAAKKYITAWNSGSEYRF